MDLKDHQDPVEFPFKPHVTLLLGLRVLNLYVLLTFFDEEASENLVAE